MPSCHTKQGFAPAGWEFILQRSQKAVGFEASFDNNAGNEQAKLLLESVSAAPTAFAHVKELRVSGNFCNPGMSGPTPQLAPHMALTSMAVAKAFTNLEVRARL